MYLCSKLTRERERKFRKVAGRLKNIFFSASHSLPGVSRAWIEEAKRNICSKWTATWLLSVWKYTKSKTALEPLFSLVFLWCKMVDILHYCCGVIAMTLGSLADELTGLV